jgi:hypothetical protein
MMLEARSPSVHIMSKWLEELRTIPLTIQSVIIGIIALHQFLHKGKQE